MKSAAIAPARFYLIGRWTFDVGRFLIASISTPQPLNFFFRFSPFTFHLFRLPLNFSTSLVPRFRFQFSAFRFSFPSTSQPLNFSTAQLLPLKSDI
jgi:hypothetical protein